MKSLRNILCPVDFSEPSYRAIEQASFLAQMLQADLTLMHVVRNRIPGKIGTISGADRASQALVAKATEDTRTLLREAKRKYVPFAINCRSAVRVGDPISEILTEAAERDSELIIIPNDLPGVDGPSNGLRMLKEATVPVLFCRNMSEEKGFRKILLVLSQDYRSKDMSTYLHAHFNIMIKKLHVLVPGGEDAMERLEQSKQDLQAIGLIDFSSQFVSQNLLVDECVQGGEETGSQLMIVAMADPNNKVENQRLKELLQKSTIPVLVWRAQNISQAVGS